MKDKYIAEQLEKFLNKHLHKKDFYCKTETGRVIKQFMIERGNWKRKNKK
jgi:cyclophilin family peptidyl-prolyl cis-trans isomerase